jgi:hypothetical protein
MAAPKTYRLLNLTGQHKKTWAAPYAKLGLAKLQYS